MNRQVERANIKIQLVSLFIDLKEWELKFAGKQYSVMEG